MAAARLGMDHVALLSPRAGEPRVLKTLCLDQGFEPPLSLDLVRLQAAKWLARQPSVEQMHGTARWRHICALAGCCNVLGLMCANLVSAAASF